MHQTYQLFGLVLSSDIPLPELLELRPEDTDRSADIRIQLVDLTESVQQRVPSHRRGAQSYQFEVKEVARYRITAGQTIEVHPEPGADTGDVRLYLLGTAVAILLHQQGRLPLHVSAIAHQGEALAFCGASGSGKSTLAAGLYRAGFTLLCDDVGLVVPDLEGRPWLYPDFPRIKLWREALAHFGLAATGLKPVLIRRDKYHLTAKELQAAFHTKPVPLTRLYELKWGGLAEEKKPVLTRFPVTIPWRWLLGTLTVPSWFDGLDIRRPICNNAVCWPIAYGVFATSDRVIYSVSSRACVCSSTIFRHETTDGTHDLAGVLSVVRKYLVSDFPG